MTSVLCRQKCVLRIYLQYIQVSCGIPLWWSPELPDQCRMRLRFSTLYLEPGYEWDMFKFVPTVQDWITAQLTGLARGATAVAISALLDSIIFRSQQDTCLWVTLRWTYDTITILNVEKIHVYENNAKRYWNNIISNLYYQP